MTKDREPCKYGHYGCSTKLWGSCSNEQEALAEGRAREALKVAVWKLVEDHYWDEEQVHQTIRDLFGAL